MRNKKKWERNGTEGLWEEHRRGAVKERWRAQGNEGVSGWEGRESPPYFLHSVLCSAQTYSTVQGWSSIKCIRQMGPCRETCRCPNQKWPYIRGPFCHLFPPLALPLSHEPTRTLSHARRHTSTPTSWLLPGETFASSVNSWPSLSVKCLCSWP